MKRFLFPEGDASGCPVTGQSADEGLGVIEEGQQQAAGADASAVTQVEQIESQPVTEDEGVATLDVEEPTAQADIVEGELPAAPADPLTPP